MQCNESLYKTLVMDGAMNDDGPRNGNGQVGGKVFPVTVFQLF